MPIFSSSPPLIAILHQHHDLALPTDSPDLLPTSSLAKLLAAAEFCLFSWVVPRHHAWVLLRSRPLPSTRRPHTRRSAHLALRKYLHTISTTHSLIDTAKQENFRCSPRDLQAFSLPFASRLQFSDQDSVSTSCELLQNARLRFGQNGQKYAFLRLE
jgi:hypothetical protein